MIGARFLLSRFCLRSALIIPYGWFQRPISIFESAASVTTRFSVEEIYNSHSSWLYDFLRNLRRLPAIPCFFGRSLTDGLFYISRGAAR
jgi:hypothetical protein